MVGKDDEEVVAAILLLRYGTEEPNIHTKAVLPIKLIARALQKSETKVRTILNNNPNLQQGPHKVIDCNTLNESKTRMVDRKRRKDLMVEDMVRF